MAERPTKKKKTTAKKKTAVKRKKAVPPKKKVSTKKAVKKKAVKSKAVQKKALKKKAVKKKTAAKRAPKKELPPIPPLPPEEEDELIPLPGNTKEPERVAPAGASPREVLALVRLGELHVSTLEAFSDEDIHRLAHDQRIRPRRGERRNETVYRLLQAPEAPPAPPPAPPARPAPPVPRPPAPAPAAAPAPAPAPAPKHEFVEGLLELHPDGYGFLRRPAHSYWQHPDDVYVAAGLIRRLRLRPGHWISGTAKPSRPGERLLALATVEEVNHEDPASLERGPKFEDLTVVYPDTRFVLETTQEGMEMRVLDLFCPLGRGQRAIITSPPRAGKTVLLQKLADAIAHNSPNVDIVVLLVDERPEEVTNMKRSVRGEVIASTFDKPAANHVRISELVMEKVKRMVEMGRHVVLLLDSITRLGRAYNNMAGPSGRILTGGLEAKALTKPKRFFGAARNIEDGGSLTIVATALIDTGSRMDDVIFEEFKGTGNMEVVLDRGLANQRIFPAINLPASGTRNEDLLLHPEELRRVNILRRAISAHSPPAAMETVLDLMREYGTNAELLMSLG